MQRKKILVIDDETEFITGLQAALKAKDCEVVGADNSEQARQTLLHERPDLIILSTIVPRGDAFLLHQWLKSDPGFKDLPLIVIDAPPEKRLIKGWLMREGLQLESDDYVSKPIEYSLLLPRIDRLLEKVLKKIRVLVVDDHAVMREGLSALLRLQRDMDVVGEAVDGQDAIDKVQKFLPDVVLMDIVMPVMSGLEATKRICKEFPQTKVLILTQYDYEENMFVARQVGAQGFIAKRGVSSDVMTAIRTVGAGRYYPPSFAYVLANWPEGTDQTSTIE